MCELSEVVVVVGGGGGRGECLFFNETATTEIYTLALHDALPICALIEGLALFWSVGTDFRAFLVVGILGSFTTFSTFSLDVMVLINRGEFLPASLYVLASVGLALAAFLGGMAAVRLAF